MLANTNLSLIKCMHHILSNMIHSSPKRNDFHYLDNVDIGWLFIESTPANSYWHGRLLAMDSYVEAKMARDFGFLAAKFSFWPHFFISLSFLLLPDLQRNVWWLLKLQKTRIEFPFPPLLLLMLVRSLMVSASGRMNPWKIASKKTPSIGQTSSKVANWVSYVLLTWPEILSVRISPQFGLEDTTL